MTNKPFEIITATGLRFRFNSVDGYSYQYGFKQGTMTDDKSVVEVLQNDEVACTIIDVVCTGYVTDETTLQMVREKRVTQCPRCGYTEHES